MCLMIIGVSDIHNNTEYLSIWCTRERKKNERNNDDNMMIIIVLYRLLPSSVCCVSYTTFNLLVYEIFFGRKLFGILYSFCFFFVRLSNIRKSTLGRGSVLKKWNFAKIFLFINFNNDHYFPWYCSFLYDFLKKTRREKFLFLLQLFMIFFIFK